MESIKIGEMFFANMNILNGYSICDKGLGPFCARFGGEETENYLNTNLKVNDCLIVVKYIGNGIFEEMTTHEKLAIAFDIIRFNGSEKVIDDITDGEPTIELTYERYVINKNVKVSKTEYANMLQKTMQFSMNHPLTLTPSDYYPINDKTKKTYLKYTDEERKKIITGAKKSAFLDAKKVNKKLAEAIEKATTISNEEIDMAYLDNQLYDFENEGRSR